MMVSMLRKRIRSNEARETRSDGVHGLSRKGASTSVGQSLDQTATEPRSRSKFEAWKNISKHLRGLAVDQWAHIGGKSCRGGTGNMGTFFSGWAAATGCTTIALGVTIKSS
jgi:hypothetical protein